MGAYVRKKETTKFCNKLSMKVNLPLEFNREKYDLKGALTNADFKISVYLWVHLRSQETLATIIIKRQ